MLSLILISLTITFLMLSVSVNVSSDNIKSEAYDKVRIMAEKTKFEFEKEFLSVQNRVDDLADYVKDELDYDLIRQEEIFSREYAEGYIQEIHNTVERYAVRIEHNVDLYVFLNPELISKDNGEFYSVALVDNGNGEYRDWGVLPRIDELDQDDPSYDWFFGPIRNAKGTWTDPYYDQYLDEVLFTYSVPMYIEGELIGIVGLDITFNKVKEIVEKVSLYETGYATLMNEEFVYLVHPEYTPPDSLYTIEDGSLEYMIGIMETKETGSIEYTYRGEEKVKGYARMSNGWYVTVNPKIDEIFYQIDYMTGILMIFALLGIILSLITSIVVGRYISKPIEKMTQIFSKISRFDLIEDDELVDMFKYKDEIGEMARSVYHMLLDQKKLIGVIKDSASNFSEIADETSTKIIFLNKLTEDEVFSMEELKSAIDGIATSSHATYEEVLSLADKHRSFTDNSAEVLDIFQDTFRNIEKDKLLIDTFKNHTEVIKKSLEFVQWNEHNQYLHDAIDEFAMDVEKLVSIYSSSFERIQTSGELISSLIFTTIEIIRNDENIFEEISVITSNIEEGLALVQSVMDTAEEISLKFNDIRADSISINDNAKDLLLTINKFEV